MLRSEFSDLWNKPESLPALPMPLQTLLTIESRLRIKRAGATEHMSYPVGQIVGNMQHETNVRQVVYDLISEFIDANDRVNALLVAE